MNQEVKNMASLVRELAISIALVALVPLLIRYGVRLFFAIDFEVSSLIGLGFLALGILSKEGALNIFFMVLGLFMILNRAFSWWSYRNYDEWIMFFVIVLALFSCIGAFFKWEQLKQKHARV